MSWCLVFTATIFYQKSNLNVHLPIIDKFLEETQALNHHSSPFESDRKWSQSRRGHLTINPWFDIMSLVRTNLLHRLYCDHSLPTSTVVTGLSTFENCLAWGTKTWRKKNILIFCSSFCLCVHQIVYRFNLKKKRLEAKKKKRKKRSSFPWCVIFYMLGGCFAFMRNILHAWHESVRNSVQAWESRSMRESWQPCLNSGIIYCPAA